MKSFLLMSALCCLTFSTLLPAQTGKPMLLRSPTISQTQIAFEYAGDIWIVDRNGGTARRLTNGVGREFGAHFSPDGTQVAFSGEYDGNIDVYVVPASGGVPRRLTYHPAGDVAQGWTPDGKRILFASNRNSANDSGHLYTIAADGVFPDILPLPMAEEGSYSPDGTHLAYVPVFQWEPAWKRYRGGQTLKIWLADLADSSIVKIPRENSNDFNPMWVGDKVYFLSDRGGPFTLYFYDTTSGKVSEALKNEGLDLKSASAMGDTIVYEQFGSLHLLDLKTGKASRVNISIAADLAELRPRFEKITATKN